MPNLSLWAAGAIRRWRTDPRTAFMVAALALGVYATCRALAASRGFICSVGPGEPWSPLCLATGSFAVASVIVFASALGAAFQARQRHA